MNFGDYAKKHVKALGERVSFQPGTPAYDEVVKLWNCEAFFHPENCDDIVVWLDNAKTFATVPNPFRDALQGPEELIKHVKAVKIGVSIMRSLNHEAIMGRSDRLFVWKKDAKVVAFPTDAEQVAYLRETQEVEVVPDPEPSDVNDNVIDNETHSEQGTVQEGEGEGEGTVKRKNSKKK